MKKDVFFAFEIENTTSEIINNIRVLDLIHQSDDKINSNEEWSDNGVIIRSIGTDFSYRNILDSVQKYPFTCAKIILFGEDKKENLFSYKIKVEKVFHRNTIISNLDFAIDPYCQTNPVEIWFEDDFLILNQKTTIIINNMQASKKLKMFFIQDKCHNYYDRIKQAIDDKEKLKNLSEQMNKKV